MGHHDTNKITLLARILIAKHGSDATAKAAERLLEWVRAGDTQTARLWVEVVQIAMGQAPIAERSPLAEILDEPATQAVMESDSVTREDVHSVLVDTKAKLRRRA